MKSSAALRECLSLTRNAWEALFVEWGFKAVHARTLFKAIHAQGETSWEAIRSLPNDLKARLANEFTQTQPRILLDKTSEDGTRKWLLQFADHNAIETVFIPELKAGLFARGTLCISSQVGCALNCDFCATGKQGFNRNLATHEIIGQVWFALQALRQSIPTVKRPITNIVFMGMGEPLMNLDAVLPTIDMLLDDDGYGLSKHSVTVSTSGLLPEMRQLSEATDVSLAVSLHAPNDALRDVLVPINKKYPIAALLDVCRTYFKLPEAGASKKQLNRKILFEYVLLAGVNDLPEHAHALAALLQHVPAKINLIPFNPFPGSSYARPTEATIVEFQAILSKAGYVVTVRTTRGKDIDAACGQLVGKFHDRTVRRAKHLASAAELLV